MLAVIVKKSLWTALIRIGYLIADKYLSHNRYKPQPFMWDCGITVASHVLWCMDMFYTSGIVNTVECSAPNNGNNSLVRDANRLGPERCTKVTKTSGIKAVQALVEDHSRNTSFASDCGNR